MDSTRIEDYADPIAYFETIIAGSYHLHHVIVASQINDLLGTKRLNEIDNRG